MSRNIKKRTFGHVRPAKVQISLHIHAVISESSLTAWRNDASLDIQNTPSEESDQTAWMHRLIWVFVGTIVQSTFCHVLAQMFMAFCWNKKEIRWNVNYLYHTYEHSSCNIMYVSSHYLKIHITYICISSCTSNIYFWLNTFLGKLDRLDRFCTILTRETFLHTLSLFPFLL